LSPIGSGIKLINPKTIMNFDDLDKVKAIDNTRNLQEISCSVWLIHGILDNVIPHKFTDEMHKKLPKAITWYPKEGDHTNILTKYRDKFFTKCFFFFNNLKYYSTKEQSTYSPNYYMNNISNVVSSKQTPLKLVENYVKNTSSIENYIPFKVDMIPNSGTKAIIPEEPFSGNSNQIKTSKFKNNNSNKNIDKFGSSQDDKFFGSKRDTMAFLTNEDDSDYEYETNYKDQEMQYEIIKNEK